MTKALTLTAPTLGHLVLDAHTTRFVAPNYHKVPVEKLLYLSTNRFRPFAGATLPLLTGEWVALVRELAPTSSRATNTVGAHSMAANGATFLLSRKLKAASSELPLSQVPLSRRREKLWREIIQSSGYPMHSGSLLDLQPLSPCSLERLHFDDTSGWGCRLSFGGEAELLDLRGAALGDAGKKPGMEEFHFVACMERAWMGQSHFALGQAAFVDLPIYRFHAYMQEMWNDPTCDLYQVRRFADLSADTQSWQSRGCNAAVGERVRQICQHLLVVAMGAHPLPESASKVTWCPWYQAGHLVANGRQFPLPSPLLAEMNAVFAAFHCHIRFECDAVGRKARFRAGRVRQKWLGHFDCCSSSQPSSHEIACAMSALMDLGWSLRFLVP